MEYNTEHLRMHPNAVVEELLRRLPGLQIDASGNITFNGQKIQHLLVDGEDIFGSDPTMVTRNFDAGKIARVQILDRKSDQAIFTGIDDGTRTKTINLVMKEEAKNGYFGKVEAGGNTDGYYNANGALAAFRNKEQFTVLGIGSNTGVTSFSSNAGGASAEISRLGGNSDVLGASAGTGIPRFAAAALHYANSWNGPVDHVSGNYQFSHYYTQPITSTESYQTLPDSIYGQQQKSHSINQQSQHWLSGTYDWVPNTQSAFKFGIGGASSEGQNKFGAAGNSSFNDTLVNSSERTIVDKVNNQNISGFVGWRIHLGHQAGRTFSITTNFNKTDKSTSGYLYSSNRFYQPGGTLQSTDTTDQRKLITDHSVQIGSALSYTQPLWKDATLGLGYSIYFTRDNPLQGTYNRGDGKYQDLVDSFSSQFHIRKTNQLGTFNLEGKAGQLRYSIGNNWIGFGYRQHDVLRDSLAHLHYFNWAPRVSLDYTANSSTGFYFTYYAITQQPSISQLAPTTNNDDPLHITKGNPDLKPGFNQNFTFDFHSFRTWLFNLSTSLALTSNGISTKTLTDSLGRQISQPVNVDGAASGEINISVNRKLLGLDAGFHCSGNYARTVNYVNADLSRNDAYTFGGGFSLNKYEQDKYSLQLNTNFAWFDQVSSINTTAPVRYWTQNHTGAVTLYFIHNWEINTNAAYTWQEKTNAFTSNTSVLLWNANVSRNLLNNKLVFRFQFNNILNSNAGITRSNVNNINTQSSTNILGRYWMISAAYHFDKKFRKK